MDRLHCSAQSMKSLSSSSSFLCPTSALPSPAAVCKALASAIVAFSSTIHLAPFEDQFITTPIVGVPHITRSLQSNNQRRSTPLATLVLARRASGQNQRKQLDAEGRPEQNKNPSRDSAKSQEALPGQNREQSDEQHRRHVIEEAWEIFSGRFVDSSSIRWQRLRQKLDARPLRSDKDLESTLQWLLTRTEDPFTRYLSSRQLEAMKGDIDGEMCGVGIIFSAERRGWDLRRHVVIKYVIPNSPAAEAGLLKGDRITAIDLADIRRMSFDEATVRLLGNEGQKVLLSFRRGDMSNSVELSVLLSRKRFEVPTVNSERVYVHGIGDVGYLQVREFATNTALQMRAAVRQLRARNGVQLFVLDIRGNSGGLVEKAIDVAKLFLERDQVVVRFVGPNGKVMTERCRWGPFSRRRVRATTEPIIVLVDAQTASASELLAAALRDNCRAVVVGRSTFGKGSVQAIVPLSNGGGAAITVARYKTPRNDNIVMGEGLRPDLVRNDLGEETESIMDHLFGRGGQKRYQWVVGRLNKCVAQNCDTEKAGIKDKKFSGKDISFFPET